MDTLTLNPFNRLEMLGLTREVEAWFAARAQGVSEPCQITACQTLWGLDVELEDDSHYGMIAILFPTYPERHGNILRWQQFRWPWQNPPEMIGARGLILPMNDGQSPPRMGSYELLDAINGFRVPRKSPIPTAAGGV